MSCTDCKGGTPTPLWKRCEGCATARLREMMGGEPPKVARRRFRIGDTVRVLGEDDAEVGTVVRVSKHRYVVEKEDGHRRYVEGHELTDHLT